MEEKYHVESYQTRAKLFGKNYGEWTSEWWKWIFSIPRWVNPLMDPTGEHADINQPASHVWFLVGWFPHATRTYPSREVIIPEKRSILFPVINCAASELEYPHLKNDHDLIEHVIRDMDTIVRKECSIDDSIVVANRVPSDPIIFPLEIHEENPFGITGGKTYAAADGYWVFLKPLPRGLHNIRFEGSCEFGRLNSGATYKVRVQ